MGGDFPKDQGTLGTWNVVSNITTPRQMSSCSQVYNPLNSSQSVLYVLYGIDNSGTVTSSYEYSIIDTVDITQPFVGSWTQVASTLSLSDHSSSAVTYLDTGVLTYNQPWILIGGGQTKTTVVGTVSALNVSASITGTTDFASTTSNYSPTRTGYNAISAAGIFYAYGGQFQSDGRKTILANAAFPILSGFNSVGTSFNTARYRCGCVVKNAKIICVGGANGATTVTNTVDIALQ